MVRVSSWGRLDHQPHDVHALSDRRIAASVLRATTPGIAFGMGRSYGDSCLNPLGNLWTTTGLDRFISFDSDTGRLVCESGVLLRDIQKLFLPRGWMLAVTPGTQLVTVGGAIANDVHGKNHHVAGSFGDHVRSITLLRTTGETIECGPNIEAGWFAATIGGLGLTGVILSATLQLRRVEGPWLATETIPYSNLDEFFQLADESEAGWEYTVSWLDCMSRGSHRGLFMRGNPTRTEGRLKPNARTLSVPFAPPISVMNKLSLRVFNASYFHAARLRSAQAIVHYEPFFYPLDKLRDWNRIYGPQGFYQYQCVVPRAGGRESIAALLREISNSGEGSFLAVLKTFGNRDSVGMLGFPTPGVTLALDFTNRGGTTHRLFERMDAILRQVGGRIYPAKDARMPRELFEAGYPRLSEFLPYRDPGISSAMSRRLMGS